MTTKQISQRAGKALESLANATRQKPLLPKMYVFRRDAADHLCRLGLADYRGFDGKTHGGYFLTRRGRAALAVIASSNSGSDDGGNCRSSFGSCLSALNRQTQSPTRC